MKIVEVRNRTPELMEQLLEIWEASVRATHLFLSPEEVAKIKEYVPQAMQGVAHLAVAENSGGELVGFMGVEGDMLEMLFLLPEERGNGYGRRLVEYGIENYGTRKVTVNEQNPLAAGFYEHLDFRTFKRTDVDEQGDPYPLLYMELNC